MSDEVDVPKFRKEMADRLGKIVLEATKKYAVSIGCNDMESANQAMKVVRLMEEAKEAVEDVPIQNVDAVLKYYLDKMDEL